MAILCIGSLDVPRNRPERNGPRSERQTARVLQKFYGVLKMFFTNRRDNENVNRTNGGLTMFRKARSALMQPSSALWQDAAGATALFVMLIVALHLPLFA